MALSFKPFRDYILVKRKKAAELVGALYISNPKDVNEGIILAVGEGRLGSDWKEVLPLAFKPGDVVVFRPGTGLDIESVSNDPEDFNPEDTFLLLRESDIVGVRTE